MCYYVMLTNTRSCQTAYFENVTTANNNPRLMSSRMQRFMANASVLVTAQIAGYALYVLSGAITELPGTRFTYK